MGVIVNMKHGISLLALLAALLAPAALAETQDDAIEAILDRMTLEEKVGQMMVASFRVWKDTSVEDAEAVDITELNDEIRTCLRDYHFGGTVLFAQNCYVAEQVLRLVADMQAENRAGGGVPTIWRRRCWVNRASSSPSVNDAENGEACVQGASEADHVVLANRVYSFACLDSNTDDGFSTAVFDEIIAARHSACKPVIVVSCQLPYDAAHFTGTDTMLHTYGSAVIRSLPPETGEGSAYAPNLLAGLCARFGMGDTNGKLPVKIYPLNANYEIMTENP